MAEVNSGCVGVIRLIMGVGFLIIGIPSFFYGIGMAIGEGEWGSLQLSLIPIVLGYLCIKHRHKRTQGDYW